MDLGVGSWDLCNHKAIVNIHRSDGTVEDRMNIRNLFDVRLSDGNFSIMNFMSALLEPISIIAIKQRTDVNFRAMMR